MGFMRQVSQALDNEHRSTLELLGRVELALLRSPRSLATRQAAFAQLAGEFSRHIELDVSRHFEFEERELFTRALQSGEDGIAGLLREEHDTIRALAAEILPLARAAATLDERDFGVLERGALEMVERQVSHIQKETVALLPLLDDLLDDETDQELALAYASN